MLVEVAYIVTFHGTLAPTKKKAVQGLSSKGKYSSFHPLDLPACQTEYFDYNQHSVGKQPPMLKKVMIIQQKEPKCRFSVEVIKKMEI